MGVGGTPRDLPRVRFFFCVSYAKPGESEKIYMA